MTSPHLAVTVKLTSAEAAIALSAAHEKASAMGVPVAVVVVDEAAAVKTLSHMDGAPLISTQMATGKAYAAVSIGMPTDDFFQLIKDDPAAVASFTSRPELALLPGGLPVIIDGTIIAGIGVAGGRSGAEDKEVAEYVVAALIAAFSG